MWQPISNTIDSLDMQEWDNLLKGILKFLGQQWESILADSKVICSAAYMYIHNSIISVLFIVQGSSAVVLLVLSILKEFVEKTQSVFQKTVTNSYEDIAEQLCPLLKTRNNPLLRIQVLNTATFLCDSKSLQEYFGSNANLTTEDVNILLSPTESHLTITETVRLIEHTAFSSDNCKRLSEGGSLEFLEKSLEKKSDPACKHLISSLVEKFKTLEGNENIDCSGMLIL